MEAISVISRQSADKTSLSVLHTASNDDFCFRSSTSIPEDERLTLLIFSLASGAHALKWPIAPPRVAARSWPTRSRLASLLRRRRLSRNAHRNATTRVKNVHVLSLLASLPPDATSVCTDGSSYGNPGRAGGRFTVIYPDDTPPAYIQRSWSSYE